MNIMMKHQNEYRRQLMIIDNLTGGGKILWTGDTALFLFRAGEDPEKFNEWLKNNYGAKITDTTFWTESNRHNSIQEWRSEK